MSQQALLALPLQGWSLSQHGERHSHHDFRWEDCGSLGRGKPMIKCCAWIEKVTSFTAENGVQETIYSGPEMYLPCSVTHWIHPLQSKRIYMWNLLCGHCSFILGLGVPKVLFVPSKSLFPQSCISSGSSMVGLMVISFKRAYAIP